MSKKEYPVVLRFEGMTPGDLAGYEAHRLRKGGDLGHVDRQRSGLNQRLLGANDWAETAQLEIQEIRQEMFAAELDYLERRKDRKAIKQRLAEGPRDPWRASRHGPLREVILTANKDWFDATEDSSEMFNSQRETNFERAAVEWLKTNFGDDVIHARADRDEQAYHIHAVILPRTTVRKYGVECCMLQPSIHPMIRNYEEAQDSVGEHFKSVGLVRGERRKQAIREALSNGNPPPEKRRHVRPAKWRQMEEKRLAEEAAKVEKRRRETASRAREAADIIRFSEALAKRSADDPVSDGDATAVPEMLREPTGPGHEPPKGIARARKAFRMAFNVLRRGARKEAEARAAAQVASAVEDIKQADQTIVEIAAKLPKGLRERIAKTRRKLTAKIMTLDPSSKGRAKGRNSDETQM